MANELRSVQGDRPHEWERHLEAMLSGQPLPENGAAGLRGVDELLAALRATTVDPVEARGQAGVLEAFRERFAMSQPSKQQRRRPAMLSSFLRARLAVALAAGVVGFGGVAAAAYTGVLPEGLQNLAHAAIGAPGADQGERVDEAETLTPGETAEKGETAGLKETPVGPDATGHAAFGLCTAWANVQAQGKVADTSIAFRNLATAAGGVNQITAYCAKIPHPGPSTHPTGKPSSHPTGKESSHPTGKPSSHPTGKESSHPTGKPPANG